MVQFKVENIGQTEATYNIYILVDGQTEAIAKGLLAAGGSRTITQMVSNSLAGTHIVSVGDLVESFTVLGPKMVLSGLQISPKTVGPSDTVSISAKVTNSGGSPGIYLYDLSILGQTEKRFNGILPVGASKMLLWKTSRDDPGGYSVSLGSLSGDFQVLAPMVDMEVPKEFTVSALTTKAVDEDGNTLTLSGDKVEIVETAVGDIAIDLPVSLGIGKKLTSFIDTASGITLQDNKLTIPIRNKEGKELLRIVAEVVSADGLGDKAQIALKKGTLKLEVPEQVVDLSADDPTIGKVSVEISAELMKLPKNAKLKVITKKTVDAVTYGAFEQLANGQSETIVDVGVAIEIIRENLGNTTDIGAVTLSLALGAAWVDRNGGKDNVKMVRRADDEYQEFLPTTYSGIDNEGRMVFDAVSVNGFSIFALVALAPKSADIVVQNLVVDSKVVAPDEAVEVTAQVANNGSVTGSSVLVLEVNGVVEEVRSVTLNAGAKTTVTFLVSRKAEGAYTVSLEGLTASFEVAVPVSVDFLNAGNLRVSPTKLALGDEVSISLIVLNKGNRKGKFDIQLKISGVIMDIKSVSLKSGGSSEVAFSYTPEAAGSYEVEVLGLKSLFEVERTFTPPNFTFSNLSITPPKAQPGSTVVVTADLINSGEQLGSKTVELKVNGVLEEAKSVTVEGLSSTPVTFSLIRQEPGVYTIGIDRLQAALEILQPGVAMLQVSISVDKEKIAEGETGKVAASVTNPNTFTIDKTLMLTVDGKVVETRKVTLAPGTSETFTFDVSLGGPGTYTIEFEGSKVIIEVTKAVESTVVIEPDETTAGSNTMILVIGVVVALVVVVGAALFVLSRRRGSSEE
jgi:hypothetical protein